MKNNYITSNTIPQGGIKTWLMFFLMFFVLMLSNIKAQVTVAGSTGANASYTTVKAAFDAINLNSNQTGNVITISITANTTELAPAILNQPTGGSWTSLTISPSGGVPVLIAGSLPFPLIGLNGADNVTIDGLNTGGNTLTIANISTSGASPTSTILFVADATNNTIQNCTIAGSSTADTLATIAFSTGLVTGNDGNTITGCTITAAGTNLPFNAIGSKGSSNLIDNSGISITNNNIQDYFSPATASNGVFVSGFSSAWTITGNKFFQTASRTSTAGKTHRAVNVITASGGGYTINNNTIGYAASAGTGVTTYAGSFANRFLGIELTAATSPVSNIQGNTIAAISISTTSGVTTAPGVFSGISVLGGNVNIGTTAGNTIGAVTGTGSISITSSTSLAYFGGISAKSTGTVSIQNNTIASILTGGTAAMGYTFNGINTAGTAGNYTISGNTIGSTATAGSITIGASGTTTTGVCKFTGIANAATGTISITGNTIQNCSAFGTGASAFSGIINTAAAGILTVSTNNIISGSNSGTGDFIGISNSAAAATVNLNNNIVRSNTITSASGAFTGIENSGVVTAAINIKDNQLGNAAGGLVTYSAANSGILTGISNNDGAAAASLTITGNDFRGITNSAASSSSHTYITNSYFPGSATISSNTFTGLNVNTTGDITFISNDVTHGAGTNQIVSNNSVVTSYNNAGVSGTVLFYNAISSSPSTVTETNSGNNFSNLTFTGAAIIYGWSNEDGPVSAPGPRKTVANNIFRNITGGSGVTTILVVDYSDDTYASNNVSGNLISNINGAGAINGIYSGSGNQNIFSNTVDSLLSSGSSNVTGIYISGGTNQNIYQNKLYYLSSSNTSSSVNGLLISDGTAVNAYNNIIGDLRTPTSGLTDAIRGISITSTTAASAINVYYNTVNINAVSSGTNFGTSGIYHSASSVGTTAALNLRNNIIVNTSTSSGTGLTVAYRRSSGTAGQLANYAAASNNNLFYAGTPGSSNMIYLDGVSFAQTLAAYKAGAFTAGTIAARDNSSITENPTFVSTTGSNINFLHINTTVPTQIESGAVNIAAYTVDFDANIRQGNGGYAGTGSSPDIGADEFNGVPIDLTAPVIIYTTLGNNSCLTSDTLSANITDGTGVNVTIGTKPRIWFKKKTNLNTLPGTNTNSTDGWKYTEAANSASPFSLIINYSLVFGGVAAGDTVQYFVTAQDAVTLPNISINSGTFAAPPTSVALTAAAFPISGTINSYKILSGLSGTVTVGTGGTYTTLTGTSGLFAAINVNGLAGNLTANILTNITETGANALNSIGYGCGSNYTLTIKPSAGVTAAITGSSAAALLKLNGADYVTIDGSNSGGTTKDLTISNTNAGTSSAVIWVGSSSASDGATHNTVKNCIITGNDPNTTLGGIISSSGTTIGSAAEAANSNNTYQNNTVNKCYYGIGAVGAAAGESGTTISNNLIGSVTPASKIGNVGLFISNQTNAVVSNNTIFGVTTSSTSTTSGILVGGAISGGSISGNKISDIKNTNSTGYGCNGILLTASSTTSNLTISNNMIWDIAGYGFSADGAADNGYGIAADGGGGYNIYFNTVSMNTDQTSTSGLPAAFNVTSGVTAANSLDVRNNIFSNTQTVGTDRFSIICEAANNVFSNINYNDYQSGADLGSFAGSNTATLTAWQSATGKDVNSISVAPVFTSASDLHLVVGSNCAIDHRGTPITGITTDIDNDTRNAGFPDIGADEFLNPAPILSSTLTPTAICSGAAFIYTAVSITPSVSFTWSRAAITGITEAAASGTSNVSEILTNTTGAPINVTYVYTTTATICSNIENVVVTVNPKPSLSSTVTPPTICSGTAFSYTATSSSSSPSFTWIRATVAGISQAGTNGNGNVNETLTNTTLSPINVTYIYTITANGCTNAPGQNVYVTVSQIPVLSSSLTPSVCSGTNFSYTATSATPGVSFTWSRAAVSGITQPGTSGNANVSEILTNTTAAPINVTYVYTTNAGGCSGGSQNVVVTVNPIPTVSFSTFPAPVCQQSQPFALTGGTPAGGTYAGPGVSAGMFTPANAGTIGSKTITYTVTVSGCANAASQTLTLENCTGIEENSSAQEVTIYPNPNSGSFNIAFSTADFSELLISIADIQGKEVYFEQDKNITNDYSKQINIKNLAKGIYFIKLSMDSDVKIQKLVIE